MVEVSKIKESLKKGVKMSIYVIVAVSVVIGFVLGIIISKLSGKKPVGCLILNETDHSKEYFEFHFIDDIDIFKNRKKISFYLLKQ